MPESVFIETTIPSLLGAFPSRRLEEAVRQQSTQTWWVGHRQNYELFTSDVVIEECSVGDPAMVAERLRIMAEVGVLENNEDVEKLTAAFMSCGALPDNADRDASHIAFATVHEIDYLLTWNCKHIANPHIQKTLRRVAQKLGWELPMICTPQNLVESDV
jgi:hypothetical protein